MLCDGLLFERFRKILKDCHVYGTPMTSLGRKQPAL